MKSKQTSSGYCRVYYSLLCLCYLEVVLWTSCLLAAGCAGLPSSSSSSYLLRETGNLKFAGKFCEAPVSLPPDLPDLHVRFEYQAIQFQYQQTVEFLSPEVLQPSLCTLRFIEEVSGVPAPYTGIKALSLADESVVVQPFQF